MEYIKLFWENAPKGEPTIILYEVDVDNQRLALRSIDIFVDGHTRNIPDLYDGAIEITPIPTVEAFNNHVWGVLGDVNNETIGHANLKNRSERTESLKRK